MDKPAPHAMVSTELQAPTFSSDMRANPFSKQKEVYLDHHRRRLEALGDRPYLHHQYPEIPPHRPGTWQVYNWREIDTVVDRLYVLPRRWIAHLARQRAASASSNKLPATPTGVPSEGTRAERAIRGSGNRGKITPKSTSEVMMDARDSGTSNKYNQWNSPYFDDHVALSQQLRFTTLKQTGPNNTSDSSNGKPPSGNGNRRLQPSLYNNAMNQRETTEGKAVRNENEDSQRENSNELKPPAIRRSRSAAPHKTRSSHDRGQRPKSVTSPSARRNRADFSPLRRSSSSSDVRNGAIQKNAPSAESQQDVRRLRYPNMRDTNVKSSSTPALANAHLDLEPKWDFDSEGPDGVISSVMNLLQKISSCDGRVRSSPAMVDYRERQLREQRRYEAWQQKQPQLPLY